MLETEELEFNKRKNKILADIQREKNLENMQSVLNDINESIKSNHMKIGTQLPNFDDRFRNLGFKLIDSAKSSRLGDTFNMLKKAPQELLRNYNAVRHHSDMYDNYYELYENDEKKYIIGCSRCLQLFSHECETKVYEFCG